MILLRDLSIQYGDRVLFKNVNFQINPTDKIALIGRNGAGKSTLFQIIDNRISPDTGQVQVQNDVQIGYLEQTLTIDANQTIRAAAQEAFKEVIRLEEENLRLQEQLSLVMDYESNEYLQLLDNLNLNLDRLNHHEVGSMDKKIELVLRGLGFEDHQFDMGVDTLSGGWQMRVQLAQLLLQQPGILLLDEPTNHLDIEAIIWLEEYIVNYPGAVMFISHDRAFLQGTASRIIEIENSQVYDYQLAYDRYLIQKQEIRTKQEAAYRNQERTIAQKERTINRFRAKATKTKMAQSMQKQLDKMERIQLDGVESSTMRMRFLPIPRPGRTVINAKDLTKSYGDHLVLDRLSLEVERADRVAIVGQNGQGKTTLVRALLKELDIDGGSVELGSQLSIGYYAQDQADKLEDDATLLEFMELSAPEGMRARVRAILGAFMFTGEDSDKKIKVLSGGERARLAFAQLLMQPINLLVLDEPSNHLDMDSKEVLKEALMDYEGTLLVISHDRDFLAGLTTRTIEMRDRKIFNYLGDVNYFLEKRSMDNLREVALHKSEPTPKVTDVAPKATHEERKKMQKALSQAERKVLHLERQVKQLEAKMSEHDFYTGPSAEKVTQEYQQLKADLASAELKWAEVVEQMESLEAEG